MVVVQNWPLFLAGGVAVVLLGFFLQVRRMKRFLGPWDGKKDLSGRWGSDDKFAAVTKGLVLTAGLSLVGSLGIVVGLIGLVVGLVR